MTLANAEAIWIHLQTINFDFREAKLERKIDRKLYPSENKFRHH
jgi:hypothetical protein